MSARRDPCPGRQGLSAAIDGARRARAQQHPQSTDRRASTLAPGASPVGAPPQAGAFVDATGLVHVRHAGTGTTICATPVPASGLLPAAPHPQHICPECVTPLLSAPVG